MAKMFYTTDEAAQKLGVSADQLKGLVGQNKLREFRDGARVMFKVDQVDKLVTDKGKSKVGEPGLSDSGIALAGPGSKSRNRLSSTRNRPAQPATTSRGLSTRSADLPLGSPISPVAPPTRPIGRCPARWNRRMVSISTRLPMCMPGAVGSNPP